MKKLTILLVAISLVQLAIGQNQAVFVNNPYPKTISVSGSAEMEVVPDEIFVNIEMREYQKKGEAKRDLETIKTHFLEACRSSGIPDSLISISSYSGSNSYYRMRRKKYDMNSSITYQVKFRSSRAMDVLVEKLDDEATVNFLIIAASHSRMPEFRRMMKIKAVQAAREKGVYLTEAINEKLGEAITVNEPDEQTFISNKQENVAVSNAYYQVRKGEQAGVGDIDFKKLKLYYEVSVVFALK